MQNLARFWTTSKSGSEYLRNWWRYSKIRQVHFVPRFLPHWEKARWTLVH